jgi:hypothetical protein
LRLWLALLLAMAAPAGAAPLGWAHYANEAYGYELDVPPGFVGRTQTEHPAGQTFAGETAEIIVWGEELRARDFEAAAKAELDKALGDGWALSFQVRTPQSAAFEVRKGGLVLHRRMIAVCEGKGVASYVIGFGRAEVPAMAPVLETMALGFRAAGDCSFQAGAI